MRCVNAAVAGLAVSANGNRLAVNCLDSGVFLWDPNAGYAPLGEAPSLGMVETIALSADGDTLAEGNQAGQLTLFHLPARGASSLGPPRQSNDGPLLSLAFAPDGSRLVAGYEDGEGRVWGLKGPGAQWSFSSSPAPLNAVAFNPRGADLAAGGGDGLATVWNVPRTGTASVSPLAVLLNSSVASNLEFVRGGTRLATDAGGQGGIDTGVGIWRIEHGRPVGPQFVIARGNSGWSVSNNGAYVLTDDNDAGQLTLWKVADLRQVTKSVIVPASSAFALSPDGKLVAIANPKATLVTVERLADRRRIATARLTSSSPSDPPVLVFSPDDRQLAIAESASSKVFDLESRRVGALPSSGGYFAFSPRGGLLAIGAGDGSIVLWSTATPHPTSELLVPADGQNGTVSLAFSPDGHTLAAALNTGQVELWRTDGRTARALGSLGVGTTASAVAFSPDGQMLAVGQYQGGVQLFDLTTQQPLGRPLGDTQVGSLAFSPDGSLLAAAGSLTLVWNQLLWSGDEFSQRQLRLCRLVGRNLLHSEWSIDVPGQPYHQTCPQWPVPRS